MYFGDEAESDEEDDRKIEMHLSEVMQNTQYGEQGIQVSNR